jgi:cation/acetate symporter
MIQTLQDKPYAERPEWFQNWENTGLLAWVDKNGDGLIQYGAGVPFAGTPQFVLNEAGERLRGPLGESLVSNTPTADANELYVDADIMVLANPEIAQLPAWVVGLVAAGGLAAALSTAAGLLLVISSAISHDLMKRVLRPGMSDGQELVVARCAAAVAVLLAGLLGIYPLGFVAQVVAFAFGLAASSFFPVIVLGVFWKRATREGAIAGMLSGILFTAGYIVYFKTINKTAGADDWLLGISPEGIGTVGMLVCAAVLVAVSLMTKAPPQEVQDAVEALRTPGEAPPPTEYEI